MTSSTASRVVVLAPNWLGDAVMALPAIRDLRNHFAGAHLTIAARPAVAKIFHFVSGVDEVLSLGGGKKDVPQLKAGRFDIAILFPNSFRSAWIARRAGIHERWGYRSDFRSVLLTNRARRPKQKVHFGEYYQELVRKLGVDNGPLTPVITLTEPVLASARKLLVQNGWAPGTPLIGVAPGAAFGHAKRWPPNRFGSLIAMARQELGATCVLLGRADDRDASQAIEEALAGDRRAVINLVGSTDLVTFMGVIANCTALVANDSGALHLAAGMGVPVVAIYGPTSEKYSTPLTSREGAADRVATVSHDVFCRPCWLRDCPIDHRCMRRIPPERVYASLRGLLQRETLS
jgi:heptosyltransferase-2